MTNRYASLQFSQTLRLHLPPQVILFHLLSVKSPSQKLSEISAALLVVNKKKVFKTLFEKTGPPRGQHKVFEVFTHKSEWRPLSFFLKKKGQRSPFRFMSENLKNFCWPLGDPVFSKRVLKSFFLFTTNKAANISLNFWDGDLKLSK